MSGTIFFFCSTSAISAPFIALRISTGLAAPKKMAKRMQEQEEEDRIVAKSKPMAMNLTSTDSTSSSFVNHPIASKSPGILKGLCRRGWPSSGKLVAREHNQDTALSSQMWHEDARMDESTRRLAAAEKDQELLNIHLLQGPATLSWWRGLVPVRIRS